MHCSYNSLNYSRIFSYLFWMLSFCRLNYSFSSLILLYLPSSALKSASCCAIRFLRLATASVLTSYSFERLSAAIATSRHFSSYCSFCSSSCSFWASS